MKRKRAASASDPVIDEKILAQAKLALQSDRLQPAALCSVCGSDCAPTSVEGLCWVCRRLKVSAWREIDPQLSAQE